MDQVKDILKQAVKYRFWIAVGISLLLPMIGYFMGAGPVKAKAKTLTDGIESAEKEVANYTSPGLPNAQYKPLVEEKTSVVSVDVNKSWEKLYKRQAPLLTWPVAPDGTKAPFYEWGRKMPENVDKGAIQKAITDFVQVYDKEVTETYKKVNPWNPIEGTGVVVVPDEKVLLRPNTFDIANPPKLGKVWAAQERLWVQGSLLDAIARINGAAKGWDEAIVKQIDVMEVGSPAAQDQKSLADGEAVEKAPGVDPEEEASAEGAGGAGGEQGAAQAAYGAPGGGRMAAGMMPGLGMGGMGGAGGGATAQAMEDIYYVTNTSTQFKVVPIQMQVLVDQNRLQDFFVGLENSPMAIQVVEFDLVKPTVPVTKPVKGETSMMGGYGMAGMMMGGRGGMGRMMAEGGGYGGGGGGMMMPPGGYGGAPGGRGGMMKGGEGYGDMAGMMGGVGGTAQQKKGTDIRSKDSKKEREEKAKARKALSRAVVDQYYDIVQVTIYGRARFYNPPPPPEPSASDASAGAAAETTGTAAASSTAPAAPTVTDPGAPPASTVTDPGAPAPKADAPKADAPKADAPKADAPKADAPKADAPKADAPKADASKAETPKTDAPKS